MITPRAHMVAQLQAAILLITFLFVAMMSSQAQATESITIKGELLLPPGVATTPYILLESSDGETMEVSIRNNGRFWVNAPVGDTYLLKFRMPGCVSKDIVIDAQHAAEGQKNDTRKIEFLIALHADNSEQSMSYMSPVGTIAFEPGSGELHVSQQYDLRRLSSFNASLDVR